jgi:hypothetical protein
MVGLGWGGGNWERGTKGVGRLKFKGKLRWRCGVGIGL